MLLREHLSASLVKYRVDTADGVLRALDFDYRNRQIESLDGDY